MLKAIVCGTIFGQVYMNALKITKNIELVGIFANGSNRSKQCAMQYRVPLYTDFESIPKDIDIAFVIIKSSVLGGKGTDISKYLLSSGINVVQEHPVNHKEMEECYKIAKENNVNYRIGNLYNYLNSIEKFIASALYLNEFDQLEYVDVMSSSQGLYTLMGILSECLPKFRTLNSISNNNVKKYPFNMVSMTNGDIDVEFRIHNEISDYDGNNHMHLLHKIVFFYKSGRLELEDTFGSVTWRTRMNIADSLLLGTNEKNLSLNRIMNFKIFDEKELKCSTLILDIFSTAIKKEIESFLKEIGSSGVNATDIYKEILTAKKWAIVTEEIGFPKSVIFSDDYIDHCDNLRKLR